MTVSPLLRSLILINIFVASAWSADFAPARRPSLRAPSRIEYRGLPLALDSWTEGFKRTGARDFLSTEQIVKEVLQARQASREKPASKQTPEFYRRLLALNLNRGFALPSGYRILAEGLLDSRRAIRPIQWGSGEIRGMSLDEERDLLLLEVLAEEALYAGAVRFPDVFPPGSIFSALYEQIDPSLCVYRGIPKSAELLEIRLCQGDVVLSKGGALSSSFLSRVTQYPGNFSHAAGVYVSNEAGRLPLLFPESLMEDGVLLRDPKKDYVTSHKRKLAVYRLRAPTDALRREKLSKLIGGMQSYERRMEELTGGEAELYASFPYDFTFDAENPDKNFCSAVHYQVGLRADLGDEWNPYSKQIWSAVMAPREDANIIREFFEDGLGVSRFKFPAPSDIETQPNYELVAVQLDIGRLSEDRIDVAIMDTFFAFIAANAQLVRERILSQTGKLSNRPVTKEDLEKIRRTGLVDSKLVDTLEEKIPPGVNLKQLVFFGMIDEILGKGRPSESLRARVMDKHDEIVRKKRQPMGLIELRKLVIRTAAGHVEDVLGQLRKFTQAMKQVEGN